MCWNYNIILSNISYQFNIWILVIKGCQTVSNFDCETLKLQSWEDIKTLFNWYWIKLFEEKLLNRSAGGCLQSQRPELKHLIFNFYLEESCSITKAKCDWWVTDCPTKYLPKHLIFNFHSEENCSIINAKYDCLVTLSEEVFTMTF